MKNCQFVLILTVIQMHISNYYFINLTAHVNHHTKCIFYVVCTFVHLHTVYREATYKCSNRNYLLFFIVPFYQNQKLLKSRLGITCLKAYCNLM